MTPISFALNHIAAPGLRPEAFFALARSLGIEAAEIRNDLTGNALLDGTPAADIRQAAVAARVAILSINALQRFDEWTPLRAREASDLIGAAKDCGAQALVLVPTNDGRSRTDLRQALVALKPMLDAAGIFGFVEPLGFATSSLRLKSQAIAAIRDIGGTGTFKLVHDTFHHHLAGKPEIFADSTGLVHISGVADPAVTLDGMRDAHRVLVDAADRLDNVGQIRALIAAGWSGPLSFEPFAPEVQDLDDPAPALAASIAYLRSRL